MYSFVPPEEGGYLTKTDDGYVRAVRVFFHASKVSLRVGKIISQLVPVPLRVGKMFYSLLKDFRYFYITKI